jgi:hypothetical protein
MIGWKPENERTKMKNYLDNSERTAILNQILDYSKTKSLEGYHYAYAFGMLSVILTDRQLKDLQKGIK